MHDLNLKWEYHSLVELAGENDTWIGCYKCK